MPIHEAQYEVSKADFINKIHISLKEASETEYWLVVLEQTGYLSKEQKILKIKCISLKKMLISTLNTLKKDNSQISRFKIGGTFKEIFKITFSLMNLGFFIL